MSKEVMKLALEALKQIDEAMPFPTAKLAQAALREALAEPQQFVPDWATYRQGFEDGKAEAIEAAQPEHEPVAYLWQHGETGRTRIVMPDSIITADANWSVVGPLYLAPPKRQPLTDEQIEALAYKHLDVGDGLRGHHFVTGDIAFARALEAAHGIKEQP